LSSQTTPTASIAKKISTRHLSGIGYEPYVKYASRSRTKAQHAPASGRSGEERHASRSAAVQVASKIMKFRRGGMIHATSSAIISVRTTSNGVAKKFLRNQPIGPLAVRGGGSVATGTSRT
jgi:hypothetical protein